MIKKINNVISTKKENKVLKEYSELAIPNKLNDLLKIAIKKSENNPSQLMRNIAIACNDYMYGDSYDDIDQSRANEVDKFFDSLKEAIESIENGYY